MKKKALLILILLVAAILRFYSLTHDYPYFFDPDERNMAGAITQFRIPAKLSEIPACIRSEFPINSWFSTTNDRRLVTNCALDPHFFAYGQFPLYLAFISDQIAKPITQVLSRQPTTHLPAQTGNLQLTTDFPNAVFWLRFYSALSSVLTVLLVYLIARQFLTFSFSLFAAAFAAFTPGLIQAAHFGTTESLLTFFFLASIYLSIKMLQINETPRDKPRGICHSREGGNPVWIPDQVGDDAANRGELTLREIKSIKQYLIPASPAGRLNTKYLILLSIVIGLSLGSKLTGAFFLFPPFIMLLIRFYSVPLRKFKTWITNLTGCFVIGVATLIGSTIVAILSSPYNLVAWNYFLSAVFGYERDVAMGKYEAFYTRQFVNSQPVIFQIQKVFPYTLGWIVFILGCAGLILVHVQLLQSSVTILRQALRNTLKILLHKRGRKSRATFPFPLVFLIILGSFWVYFIPNAFLFAKWTRFMTPILPFFSIFAAYVVSQIYQRFLSLHVSVKSEKIIVQSHSEKLRTDNYYRFKLLAMALIFALCALSLFTGVAFMSIYTHKDSRLTASRWIYQNIPDKSYVLSETANVVDIPLGLPTTNNSQPITPNYTVISFDFYHMDENPALYSDLLMHLERANYIFIPSRRIFANYPLTPQKYPLVTKYYQLLFSGRLGFEKVAEINSFPKLEIGPPAGGWKLEFNDERSEETYTVFDHPVIRIYKKIKPLSADEYRNLFSI